MNLFLKNIIRFSLKGLLLFILIFGINSYWVRTHPFPELKQLQEALDTAQPFIFFGDSVNRHYAKNDTDKRSIAEILDAQLVQSVTGISYYAYHSELYLAFIKHINRTAPNKKVTILIPINLRSFSPEWDLRPNYQFLKEKYALNGYPYWRHFNFNQYELIHKATFEKTPILYENKKIGTVATLEKMLPIAARDTSLRYGFIYHYMQAIPSDHRKIKALQEIAHFNKNRNLDIRFYFTPIDYMLAEKIGIQDFRAQIASNKKVIQAGIQDSTTEIIDLSLLLDSTQFDYEKIPNEHLNQYGKEVLVHQLELLFRAE